MTYPIIFDGHNDTILKIHEYAQVGIDLSFIDGNDVCHIDLPRAKQGGLGGGFFAVYTPNELRDPRTPSVYPGNDADLDKAYSYQFPLPPQLEHGYALRFTLELAQKLFALEKASDGKIKIVRDSAELTHCLENDIFAIIFHIEGAESIDADLHALYVLHALGLRSLGIVWSRPTIFGEGVPFHFPAHPNIGDGLTDAGKRLVKACNDLNIMLDLSHLNEKGFWDVAALSDAPLVCTHSGAHAMAQSPRNLLDAQLDAIKRVTAWWVLFTMRDSCAKMGVAILKHQLPKWHVMQLILLTALGLTTLRWGQILTVPKCQMI